MKVLKTVRECQTEEPECHSLSCLDLRTGLKDLRTGLKDFFAFLGMCCSPGLQWSYLHPSLPPGHHRHPFPGTAGAFSYLV